MRGYYALSRAGAPPTAVDLSIFRFLAAEMNKKRAAPGATSSASSAPSKKRKMDNVQKYYAVKAGATPGVYLTYAECQEQTAGYKGALCGSLLDMPDEHLELGADGDVYSQVVYLEGRC